MTQPTEPPSEAELALTRAGEMLVRVETDTDGYSVPLAHALSVYAQACNQQVLITLTRESLDLQKAEVAAAREHRAKQLAVIEVDKVVALLEELAALPDVDITQVVKGNTLQKLIERARELVA